ncbi:MAG: hypothetical protein MJ247_04860 [Alphaproteobacteria bacterium]|nr:hypothetical protein [Alphaproteobacteria bacterium]
MHPENILSVFVSSLATPEVIIACLGILAAAAFAGVLATKLGEIILPRPKETQVSDFLPFERLKDDGTTIECREGSLLRIFSLKGIDLALVPPEFREQMLEARKTFIDSMAESNITIRVLTIREMVPLEEEVQHTNKILHLIADRWTENLSRVFRNRHYIILSTKERKNHARDLNSAAQALMTILDDYGPKALVESKMSDIDDSPFTFLARLCSPISTPKPRIGHLEGAELKSLLTADYIHFTGDEGMIRFFSGEHELRCIVMGLRSAGDYMDEQMISDIMSIDCEINILHNINPIPKAKAMALLAQQQRMSRVTSFSGSTAAQYEEAMETIDSADANTQTLCHYALTIFIFGTSPEELEYGQMEIERICRLYGTTPVREGWVAQASFFAQFPTYEIYPRTYMFLSRAVATAINIEQATEGIQNSDWGKGPITIFRTISGTPYRWQFHVSAAANAVAHCILLGSTGQGKTTLLAFLAGQAMRHPDLRVFFFDRHLGVKVFCNSIQGAYVNFDGDKDSTSMNPFACKDLPENRAFLRRWLKAITMVDDATSEKEIARAVTTAFDYLRPEERTLKNLHKSCFSPTGAMRRELFRWVNDQQYGLIFNSPNDTLDMTAHFVAFDFTHIFEDDTLAPAVIGYIMHRIHSLSTQTGDPSLIMIDETAPMLKHPMFRDQFIIGLQEGRKKRQAYLCAFQQPNIVDGLGLGEVVRGQCQTMIFFRNPQGTEEDYMHWNLTPNEEDFVLGRSFKELKYAILVKRPAAGESVILDVNLGGLGPYLKLYSSGAKHVLLSEQLIKEFGPDAFIDKYLDQA